MECKHEHLTWVDGDDEYETYSCDDCGVEIVQEVETGMIISIE